MMYKRLSISPLFWSAIFVWLVMAILFWLQPYMTDNYIFSRHMVPGYAAFVAGSPIERMDPLTLAGAYSQAVEMYFTWCGRFMGNLVVYLLFMLPKPIYVCFAACCCVVYIMLLHILIAGQNWRINLSSAKFLLLAVLVWVGLPSFGSAFFWLCIGGYIALLGQAFFLIPYRFAIDCPEKLAQLSYLQMVGMFLLGMVVASLDYPSSVALPVASCFCVTYLIWSQPKGSRKIPWNLLAGFIGVSIGAFLTLMAPGNAGRLALTTDAEVHAWLAFSWGERILSWLTHLPEVLVMMWLPLLLLGWAFSVLWGKKRSWNFVCTLSPTVWLMLLPACATVGSYMFTSWPPLRAFNTVAAQLIVMSMIVVGAALPLASQRAKRWYITLRLLLVIICLLGVGVTMMKMWIVHYANVERERIIDIHKGGEVLLPPLPERGNSHMVLGTHLMDITPNPNYWLNRAVAAFYGLKSIALDTPSPKSYLFEDENYKIELSQRGRRVDVRLLIQSRYDRKELHFYYFGLPALLSKVPKIISDPILRWLGEAKIGDARLLLVPILLARSDIKLEKMSDILIGHNTFWGLEYGHGIWVVRPGGSKISFDILPLDEMH